MGMLDQVQSWVDWVMRSGSSAHKEYLWKAAMYEVCKGILKRKFPNEARFAPKVNSVSAAAVYSLTLLPHSGVSCVLQLLLQCLRVAIEGYAADSFDVCASLPPFVPPAVSLAIF